MSERLIDKIPDGRVQAWGDAAVIVSISAAAAVVCVRFDLSEALFGWTRLHERLQLDELPGVLLIIAVGLAWFSARRYREAHRQLLLRRVTEQRLAEALVNNQRLAQQYVDVQESERKALARDLHDELGQFLNVVKLDAVSIRDAPDGASVPVQNAARTIIDKVDRLYGTVATLIRRLRPAGFDELGVAAALESCLNDWRARLPEVAFVFSIDDDVQDLDEVRALALFRLVQEALTNVARHARASQVDVRIAHCQGATNDGIEARIADNGNGADLKTPQPGFGLMGMRERVAAFGGSLTLTSQPGQGFVVVAWVPLGREPVAQATAGVGRAAAR